ncbi:MAG: hypothetical protein OXF33_06355 [Rhodospirillales bacterium]|nr:hypothetical protein [Rhodospirillales bacterium]
MELIEHEVELVIGRRGNTQQKRRPADKISTPYGRLGLSLLALVANEFHRLLAHEFLVAGAADLPIPAFQRR